MIHGGALLEDLMPYIDETAHVYKGLACMSFEEFRNLIIENYNESPESFSPNGSKEDLEELLRLFEIAWNKH